MDKLRAAATMALEALESCEEDYIYDGENEYECDSIDWDKRNAAITALREALAEQAEQEPVAFWNGKETAWFEHELCGHPAPDGCTIPLYAAPVRTKDLTDAELHQIWRDIKSLVGLYSFQEIARAVIAADREKNK